MCECIEDVGDRDDSADEWDGFARKSLRVARAVPALVVAFSDDPGQLKSRRAAAKQQARAERGVGLHDRLLLCAQLGGLEQDAVLDRELADVVQRRGLPQKANALGAEA